MKALIISGNTLQETNWDIEDILNDIPQSTKDAIDRIQQYEWDSTIGRYTQGLTYLEIEQFNNTYNNF
jgi:hypothetical protein